ncbi:MAG: hypothetical protein ACFE8B_02320 [Candidatus Hermodarchaeota archaeon]
MPTEEIKDPYEKILLNMREYPNDIPITNGKISDAFREFIMLLFNPEEAEVAQYLKVRPQSVGMISKKIGKNPKETQQLLEK